MSIGKVDDPIDTSQSQLTAASSKTIHEVSRSSIQSLGTRWLHLLRSGDRRARILWVMTTVLLLSVLLPPVLVITNLSLDYVQIKALGKSGLEHLLAAKADLAPLTSGQTPLQGLGGHVATLGSSPSYTLLVQRQSGTSYTLAVTIQPSPKQASQGLVAEQLMPVIIADTSLSLGGSTSPTTSPGASPNGRTPASLLPDPAHLKAAQNDLRAAQRDFRAILSQLRVGSGLLSLISRFPGLDHKLTTTLSVAVVGYDLATVGFEVLSATLPLLQRLSAGPFASTGALMTLEDVNHLQQAFTHADELFGEIAGNLSIIDLKQLSLTTHEQATFAEFVQQLPSLRNSVRQVALWVPAFAWLLGVGQPRHFLVQTLDRAELRPSGGFTGDYGILTLSGGMIQPFSLYNVNDIDYGYKTNGWIFGRRPPASYSWWPFANWGLRDANLSSDFPTTAQIEMQVFRSEGGDNVDGVIQLSPVVIAHVLNVTGPISVPDYNETITAENLEAKIHYYQQDPAGIAKQQQLNPNDHTHSLRKRFTQLVVQLLQDKVKHLSPSQLSLVATQVWRDLRAKDLQLYVANATVESLLAQQHVAGQMDAKAATDSYGFVQANVSAAKSTPYIDVTQRDDITLDGQGGALHHLTVSFLNNPQGPIYGDPTYRDYVRVYVPPQARLVSGSGFDLLSPLCYMAPPPTPSDSPQSDGALPISSADVSMPTPSTTVTPLPIATPLPTATPTPTPVTPPQYAGLPPCTPVPYSLSERTCPNSAYASGGAAFTVLAQGNATVPVLDTLGAPPNRTSDLPGFAMWGGYVIIPVACTAIIHLSWYVPGVVHI